MMVDGERCTLFDCRGGANAEVQFVPDTMNRTPFYLLNISRRREEVPLNFVVDTLEDMIF